MSPNQTHGISPQNPRPFNSLAEMAVVIERVLAEHGVKLHPTREDSPHPRTMMQVIRTSAVRRVEALPDATVGVDEK